ncbi:LuxR family transcriptional regulator [Nonomuraea jabiensis]|uniref:ATP-binding protein n=1 Tax=Nonomuraea jabiensis TaxID=882448 RepID=UPI00341DCCCE
MSSGAGVLTDQSTFVGRAQELSTVRKLLGRSRLLTLTGGGGVGKTRLALRAAELLRDMYQDGVEVVELATLETGDLLESEVATALGLRDVRRDPMGVLVDYLSAKRMLLVLDNCEHLSAVCARFVDRLLRSAPRLQVLATSRQTLRISGEQVLAVAPLSTPDSGPGCGHTVREVGRHDSVRLFVERAAGAVPGFRLNARNVAPVAELVRRLEGIPLAIELAAVRLRSMPLERLARELEERFDVLVTKTPTVLPRHQTMRATMEWSFRLCSAGERRLWARLGLFPSGADLETAEAVCSGDGIDRLDVLDHLTGLVDKSVLVRDGSRYRMPEALRAYGCEQLPPPEERWLRRRYVEHYRDLVKEHRIDRMVPEQLDRYLLLQRELPNIRVALEMCLSEPALAPTELEAASAMWCFWLLGGSFAEGRYWLGRGLEQVPRAGRCRAEGLWADSLLALRQGQSAAAMRALEEFLAFAREHGEDRLVANGVRSSGVAAFFAGDAQRGLALIRESLTLHEALDDMDGIMFDLYVGAVYGSTEHPRQATEFGERLLTLCESRSALVFRAYAQLALGVAHWNLGERRRAEALLTAATEFTGGINDRWCLTQCLEVLAWLAGARDEHERAAALLGAAHAMWQAVGASPEWMTYHATWHERCTRQARAALGRSAFATAFRQGARLGPQRAAAYAVGGAPGGRSARRGDRGSKAPVTTAAGDRRRPRSGASPAG